MSINPGGEVETQRLSNLNQDPYVLPEGTPQLEEALMYWEQIWKEALEANSPNLYRNSRRMGH